MFQKDFAFIFDSILLACHSGERRIKSCGENDPVQKYKLPIVKVSEFPDENLTRNRLKLEKLILYFQPFKGLTGTISFNGTSERSDSELHIWEMGITGAGLHVSTLIELFSYYYSFFSDWDLEIHMGRIEGANNASQKYSRNT